MDGLLALQKILAEARAERAKRRFIPLVHHILMREYGYIPLEEFKKLPLPTILTLLKLIKEEYKERNATYSHTN